MPARISPTLCAQCKGSRRLCGRIKCPILVRLEAQLDLEEKLRRNVVFGATPPEILVGEFGYPEVRVGPLIPPILDDEVAAEYGNPSEWYGKKLEDIIKIRSKIVRASFKVKVREASTLSSRLLNLTQELAMSIKPVDTEAHFHKPPTPRIAFDGVLSPIGPSANIRKLIIAENPSVPKRVEQAIYDYDARASIIVGELYDRGYTNYYLTQLLTAGLLGQRRERRIVPTRWGITAVDSIIGDHILEKIRDYQELNQILLYSNSYLDNHYYILLMPGAYAFEMIEIWLPQTVWVKEAKPYIVENFELYDGKWRRSDIDGGYKAMRLAVLEHLNKIKRQAMTLAVREIGPGYYCPVGVWQVREGMRKAFLKKPQRFSSIDEALKFIQTKIRVKPQYWINEARIVKLFKFQRKITSYFKQ